MKLRTSFYSFLVLSLFLGASSSQANLIAHYRFENAGNLGLDSTGNHPGTVTGADASFSSDAAIGTGALALDGTGRGLELANPDVFQPLTRFTIAAFVNPDLGNPNFAGVGRIFGALGFDVEGGTNSGYAFGVRNDGGLSYTNLGVQDLFVAGDLMEKPLRSGEWRHVAVSFDHGIARFFVDGFHVGTRVGTTNNGLPAATTNPFHLGAAGFFGRDPFVGLIDDVRIYDEILGDPQIARLADPDGTILTLLIDRGTGNITLSNDGPAMTTVSGYTLRSDFGGLNSNDWLAVANTNNDWLVFEQTEHELSEGTLGEMVLAGNQSLSLGTAWRLSPTEDVTAEILLSDGSRTSAAVGYVGDPVLLGDLNGDGIFNHLDWQMYRAGFGEDLSGLSGYEAYIQGDMNGDGVNDEIDFGLFKSAFIAASGEAAFYQAVAGVPEPGGMALTLAACVAIACCRRRLAMMAASVAMALLAVTAMPALAGTPSLVAHFPLDVDGSDSTGNFQGMVTGVTFGAPGANTNTGTAAIFDGTASKITVPFDSALNPESFTLTAWAYSNTNAGFQSIVTSRHIAAGNITHGYILYNDSAGRWDFWTGTNTTSWARLNAGAAMTETWTHLAVTFDAETNTKSIYRDGVLAAQVTNQAYSANGSKPFHIGAGGDDGDLLFFNGMIDDVALFKGVLSATEIAHVRDNSAAGFVPLRLELQVDTVSGNVVLSNSSPISITTDQYSIRSPGASLDPGAWESLEFQNLSEFPAGDGNGNGWEVLGTPRSDLLAEGFLLGDSTFAVGSGPISLGSMYDVTKDARDLKFTYRQPDGTFVEGVVTYLIDALPGDFNGDGRVDAADYTVWRDTINDPAQYAEWKANFGAGALAQSRAHTQAVPEPSTALLGLVCLIGLAVARSRGRGRRRALLAASLILGVLGAWVGFATPALAARTLDRDYGLGDHPDEGALAGQPVGSGNEFGDTFDDAGTLGHGDVHDLTPVGGPIYVNVSDRPLAGGGLQLGVLFNGVDQYLRGLRLGFPQTSASANPNNVVPRDYSNITNRGMQFWVNPTDSALGNGTLQSVIVDTNQHGVLISGDGTWVMRLRDGGDFDTGVPVATGEGADGWSHVMHVRSTPSTGTSSAMRMYVNGIAIGAGSASYSTGDNSDLVLGANTAGSGANFTGGTDNFFAGIIDNLELYVLGSSTNTNTDYGILNLREDNEFIANALADRIDGDLTGNGLVMGTGLGDPTTDDVAAFIQNWGFEKMINGIRVGDLETYAMGDFNLDGRVDLADWQLLRANHSAGASLNLGALLAGVIVPEPSAALLLLSGLVGGLSFSLRFRRRL